MHLPLISSTTSAIFSLSNSVCNRHCLLESFVLWLFGNFCFSKKKRIVLQEQDAVVLNLKKTTTKITQFTLGNKSKSLL